MNAVINETITAGSTNDTALSITNAKGGSRHEFLIKVISGTVKFGVRAVNANAHGYTAGETLIITCGNSELHFQAASAADTFVVTV